MSQVASLGTPVKVSPFIRFCRWSFLFAGVLYGSARYSTLKKREDERRAYVEKMTPVWTAQREAKKAELNKQEMDRIAKETGVQF